MAQPAGEARIRCPSGSISTTVSSWMSFTVRAYTSDAGLLAYHSIDDALGLMASRSSTWLT